ncbi:MAG: hypothetical protein HY842_07295 [Bacteroidetes bacterium]|nr:hypothetical protein [Bacteroidota bacterium]
MAKQNARQAVPIITELIKPIEQFRKELQDRIAQGKSLLEKEIKTIEELDEFSKSCGKWNDYKSELLKSSFNPPFNEYKKRYDDITLGLGLRAMIDGKRSYIDPDLERYDNLKETLGIRLRHLENLEEKVDLLRCSIEKADSEFVQLPLGHKEVLDPSILEKKKVLLGSINSFVIEGQLEEALDNLEKAAFNHSSLAQEAVLLKAKLKDLEKKERLGIAHSNEIETDRNKLRKAILDLKDQMLKS